MTEPIVLAAGSALVVFSAFCFLAAVWRELFPGAPPPRPDVRQIPPLLLIAPERKQLQIETAPTKSRDAKLLKLADHLSLIASTATSRLALLSVDGRCPPRPSITSSQFFMNP